MNDVNNFFGESLSSRSSKGCSGNGVDCPRRRPRYRLRVEALSSEEWNYIRGLFFSDGNTFVRGDGRKDYRVTFFFQGDEGDLASRLVAMLERGGLRPKIGRHKREDMWVVRVSSRSLLEFLPDRGALKNDMVRRERFLQEHGLLKVEGRVPFLAGLLDGDGRLRVRVNEKCFRRSPSMG